MEIIPSPDNLFTEAAALVVKGIASRSARVYLHTYTLWADFAAEHSFPPAQITAAHLYDFIESAGIAHTTAQARLSHMRKLLEVMYALHPDDAMIESLYRQSKLVKVQRDISQPEANRQKHALSRNQVYKALELWGADEVRSMRNRALLAVLFYAGLRRGEAADLHWSDIDLQARHVTVRHGKGDKSRIVPILGDDTPMQAIRAWQEISIGREWVFCGVRKGNHFDVDKPMSTTAIYKIIKETGDYIGIDIAPHDARRTLITALLRNGTPTHYVQKQAGHVNSSTTLLYAQVKDADEIAANAKLDY